MFQITKDINNSIKLLKREGFREFIRRLYWYLKGKRFLEDIPVGIKKNFDLITKNQSIITFSIETNPLVSIIIPVFNNWNYTYTCLHSIHVNTQSVAYEIILIDDCSTDETKNVDQYVKNIRIIRNNENKGFLLNCNNAALNARGKYLVMLNNDTIVQPEWLHALVETMEKYPDIGLTGAKIIFANGSLQEAGGIIFKDGHAINYGRGDNPDLPQYNYFKNVDYCTGACICVRKEIWNRTGGFDEQYSPAYYEDTDLAFSIRKLGYRTVYQPRSLIVHFESISLDKDINEGLKTNLLEKNRLLFLGKWKEELKKNYVPAGQNIFQARDKSCNKLTIVMIDAQVPAYDKDAGSGTTFQYLRLLVEMGLNVKFLPDNFVKSVPYVSELEEMGIEVLYGRWYQNNWQQWMTENAEFIHYVFMNRPDISIKYINFIRNHLKTKVIYQLQELHL